MPDRIVELDGVQHHFPSDATDAEIATALKSAAPPEPQWGMHPTREQEALTKPEADWKSDLAGVLEPLAHPKSAGDFGNLLIPSGGAEVVGKALRPIGAAIGKYGSAAAKVAGAAATTMLPSAMVTPTRSALKVLSELKPSEWASPLTVAGRETRAHRAVEGMVDRYKPNVSSVPDRGIPHEDVLPTSSAVEVDRYLPNKSGVPDRGIPTDEPLPQAGTSHVSYASETGGAGHLTAEERAALVKQGYTPALIEKIEQTAARSGTTPRPFNLKPAPGFVPPEAASSARPPIAVDESSLPESWKPPAQAAAPTGKPSLQSMFRPPDPGVSDVALAKGAGAQKPNLGFKPGIKVLTPKATPESWTPEAARARIEFNDWHSGAEPGTPDAQRWAGSHRFDRELRERMKFMLDNPKGALAGGTSVAEALRELLADHDRQAVEQ